MKIKTLFTLLLFLLIGCSSTSTNKEKYINEILKRNLKQNFGTQIIKTRSKVWPLFKKYQVPRDTFDTIFEEELTNYSNKLLKIQKDHLDKYFTESELKEIHNKTYQDKRKETLVWNNMKNDPRFQTINKEFPDNLMKRLNQYLKKSGK